MIDVKQKAEELLYRQDIGMANILPVEIAERAVPTVESFLKDLSSRIREEVIEECAKVAGTTGSSYKGVVQIHQKIAQDIRSLKQVRQ